MAALSKQELRQQMLERIKHQQEEEAVAKSRVVCCKLLALEMFCSAATVMFYCSVRGEVDTRPMMDAAWRLNKRVAVPLVNKETKRLVPVMVVPGDVLVPGGYGIPEPRPEPGNILKPADVDLVIVPGLAFDDAGNRLGRGAGYYDRFLADLPSGTPAVGLGYDFQRVPVLPGLEPHDRRLTAVITN